MKRIWHWLNDRKSWRVVYPDGNRTFRMRLATAWDYRKLFGGHIIFDPSPDA